MTEEQTTRFPKYVTDGSHIYLWLDEFEAMLQDGRLRPSDPPVPRQAKDLTPREKNKIEEMRKKALQDAENAVKILRAAPGAPDLSGLFGDAPKE